MCLKGDSELQVRSFAKVCWPGTLKVFRLVDSVAVFSSSLRLFHRCDTSSEPFVNPFPLWDLHTGKIEVRLVSPRKPLTGKMSCHIASIDL